MKENWCCLESRKGRLNKHRVVSWKNGSLKHFFDVFASFIEFRCYKKRQAGNENEKYSFKSVRRHENRGGWSEQKISKQHVLYQVIMMYCIDMAVLESFGLEAWLAQMHLSERYMHSILYIAHDCTVAKKQQTVLANWGLKERWF